VLTVAVALGALVGIAIVVALVHHHRRDELSPSVQDFAAFRSALAATERHRTPPTH
jgi:hypothetical protein